MLKNIIGSVVFTAAVFALVNFIGNVMVNPNTAPRPQKVEVAAPTPAPTPAPAQEQVAAAVPAIMATTGDIDAGKKSFRRKCMGCHTIGKGDRNRTGPNLWGIVGKAKAAAEGYRYSKPMRVYGGVWSAAEIKGFMAGPRTFMPDTKMTFAGIKKESERDNIVAYLETLKD